MKKKYKNRFVNLSTGEKSIAQPKSVLNEEKSEATIYLYDEINAWWSGSEWFVEELKKANDMKTVHVRVNSPGGDYFEAMAMKTAMAQHPAEFVVHIDGMAASAASFFVRGANKIIMTRGAFIMTHRASCFSFGNAKDLESDAALLRKIDNEIIEGNMKYAGVELSVAEKWVDDETWFSADEALEHGFIHAIEEAEPVRNEFDLKSVFNNVPEQLIKEKKEVPVVEEEPEEEKIDFAALARERELELLESE